MFSMFTFDFLASFVLMVVVAMGTARSAEADKETQAEGPGHRAGAAADDHRKVARDGRKRKKYIGVPWPF